MNKLILAFFVVTNLSSGHANPVDSLMSIRAYHKVSYELASSGYVFDDQFDCIRDYGYSHVISLLSGDQNHEESVVTSKGMTFTNIPVDWENPTLKNLEDFIEDMGSHQDEMVYVHCEANMMASAFMFLYQVTQLGVDKEVARADLESVWYPTDHWHQFIEMGLQHYGLDPEYRFEPEFIILLRKEGLEAAELELEKILKQSVVIPFSETDLERIASEFRKDKKMEESIRVHQMNTLAFPGSWKTHEQLGNILMETQDIPEAVKSFERVLELDPDHIWAKRMLGKSGNQQYLVFWEGVEMEADFAKKHAGRYDLGNTHIEFSFTRSGFYLTPSWSKKKIQLFADSPIRFFTHENNWMFEFPVDEPAVVKFIMSRRTDTGRKVR